MPHVLIGAEHFNGQLNASTNEPTDASTATLSCGVADTTMIRSSVRPFLAAAAALAGIAESRRCE